MSITLPTIEEALIATEDKNNPGFTDTTKYHIFYKWQEIDRNNIYIRIRHTWYIEKLEPIVCDIGNFYDKDTGKCLGKSFKQYIYFYDNNGEELNFPRLIPDVEWRLD